MKYFLPALSFVGLLLLLILSFNSLYERKKLAPLIGTTPRWNVYRLNDSTLLCVPEDDEQKPYLLHVSSKTIKHK